MTEALRVLLVEDSVTDAKLVTNELRKSFGSVETEQVETAEDMRVALAKGRWDLVICDWSMPRFSAVAALSLLKDSGLDLPFIIVSATVGEENAVRAMRAGAHDYLLKDKLARLAPAIERELRERKDRHARRGAEDALRKSQARFARLEESGIIGISVADVTGNTLEANDAYLGMLGYTREEFVAGRLRWDQMTPPEWQEVDQRALALLKASGVAPPWEKELFRKDGTRVPILVGVAMLDYPQCIAFIADLTDRKKIEAALAQSQEQSRQMQKMEAVGRLAGGVAHDFNNLLSVILSYSEMGIRSLLPSDPLRADLEEIKKAGDRATSLTTQLLAFSRQQVLDPRVLNLNELIVTSGKMIGRLIGEDIQLVVRPFAELGLVLADPGQMEQVLLNLAVNARDAMPKGGKLTIETANVELTEEYVREHLGVAPGSYVMLAVSDTGTGMDKATQARIFEPFFTTKEKGKGTGLGLATVFGIAQQSKGHVWVYSEPGLGASFKLYLPRTERRVATEEVVAIELTTLSGHETILLVEDEDQIRAVVLTLLRAFGYKVLEARNGGEALLISERHPTQIDLLLTDVVMPFMGGPELAKRLASSRAEMKVLCMSGYTDEAVLSQGILDAGWAFLQKPITPDRLARKIREVLTQVRPLSAEARAQVTPRA